MLFTLTLQPLGKQNIIPINYPYENSGWINKTIHLGNAKIFLKPDLPMGTAPGSVGYIINADRSATLSG
jgi:hypothetical protein